MTKLNSIGSIIVLDHLCPQYRDGTPDTEAGVYLGDIYICDLDGISEEDKAVLQDAIEKENQYVYALVYKSDFITPSDSEENYQFLSDALFALRHSEERDELTILRAPDSDSDFNHVWEGESFTKYC